MPFGPSPGTPGARLVRGTTAANELVPAAKEAHAPSQTELGRRKSSSHRQVAPAEEDQHARPARRPPPNRRSMSPTCLLCFMVVLLGLVKLIPSVLHSHPVHETTSPDAALTAVSYQPDAIAPPSAVPGAGIPMAVPARDDGPELRPAASVPPAAELPPRKHAPKAAKAGGERCISFQTELCPPLNLSLQTQEQQSQTHLRCAPIVKAEQAHLPPGAGFCGRQLPRPSINSEVNDENHGRRPPLSRRERRK